MVVSYFCHNQPFCEQGVCLIDDQTQERRISDLETAAGLRK